MAQKSSLTAGQAGLLTSGKTLAEELERINHLEHLEKDEQLHLSGDWVQTLVNHVSDRIYVKDRSHRFVMANRQVAIDLGLNDASQVIGRTDVELHPIETGSKFAAAEVQIMASKEARIDFEEMSVLANGKRRWLSSSKFPVLNERDEVVGIVGISRDITERKKSELLQQGQKQGSAGDCEREAPSRRSRNSRAHNRKPDGRGCRAPLMLVSENGENLQAAVAPNLPKEYVDLCDGIPVGPKVGSCGTAVLSARKRFC